MFALAVLAFIAFALADLFKSVGQHADILQWLIIIGGLLGTAALIAAAWDRRPLWAGRRP